jgi:hypothetical protein
MPRGANSGSNGRTSGCDVTENGQATWSVFGKGRADYYEPPRGLLNDSVEVCVSDPNRRPGLDADAKVSTLKVNMTTRWQPNARDLFMIEPRVFICHVHRSPIVKFRDAPWKLNKNCYTFRCKADDQSQCQLLEFVEQDRDAVDNSSGSCTAAEHARRINL